LLDAHLERITAAVYDLEHDLPVTEEEHLPFLRDLEEPRLIDTQPLRVSRGALRVKAQDLAAVQVDAALLDLADPHFRPGKVLHHRDAAAKHLRSLAHRGDEPLPLLRRAVTEIDARGVHTTAEHRGKHLGGSARWTHGGKDLRAPHMRGEARPVQVTHRKGAQRAGLIAMRGAESHGKPAAPL
jgi:hypothetical protein